MEPLTYLVIGGWLSIVTGPFGGAFALGVIVGSLAGIWLWQKYVVKPKLEDHVKACEDRLNQLEKELIAVRVLADKWSGFIERKALEALGEHRSFTP